MTVSPILSVHTPPSAATLDRRGRSRLEPHHVGVAGMGKFVNCRMVRLRLAVERAQIDLGFGVEDEPQRVGALKYRRADRSLEGERST